MPTYYFTEMTIPQCLQVSIRHYSSESQKIISNLYLNCVALCKVHTFTISQDMLEEYLW